MKHIYIILLGFFLLNANPTYAQHNTKKITFEQANKLAALPLACIQVEYPNKLNQTIADKSEIKSPKELHPSFYGCFDWHSSVHGHWSLIALLKQFPNLKEATLIRKRLSENISKSNIEQEITYFKWKYNGSFERTYGWAWMLKLAEEIYTWNDPLARELEVNLQPLVKVVVDGYLDFLPKLNYPIRVGEHTNTAFGLTFAYDFAVTTGNVELEKMIVNRAKDFYLEDANCPMTWEPSGFDFLSPCLEEMDVMRRVLPAEEFIPWVKAFLPHLSNKNYTLSMGKVSDRTDGKLVHLDGVNFSRAWCLYGLANQFERYSHLKVVGNDHINYSLPSIVGDSYEGSHWLGSFAIYALKVVQDE